MLPQVGGWGVYGEFIFCTEDGSQFAYCNAFEDGPQLISDLMGKMSADIFQSALAHFADPIGDARLTRNSRCPKWFSTSLKRYAGASGTPARLPHTKYDTILSLSRELLEEQLKDYAKNWQR